MNNLFFSLGILLMTSLCFSSCEDASEKNMNQLSSLKEKQKEEFTQKLIRYIGRKPENASDENKFHSFFDEHYKHQVALYTLEYYLKSDAGKEFFLFTKIAPSIKKKKIAIGGWVQFSKDGSISEYEEVFHTWKQEEPELKKTSELLFFKMVNGESLEEYMTKNSNQLGLIEFPNSEVHYDKKNRVWVSERIDPLDQFYQEKIKQTQQQIDSLENSK